MSPRENPFFGWNVKEIARICRVNLTTARRWKRGARCPPESAVLLIRADLGMFDRRWGGWQVRGDTLFSPEGWAITVNDVLSVPLMRLQISTYQAELRAAREELSILEQPAPDEWPDWVHALSA